MIIKASQELTEKLSTALLAVNSYRRNMSTKDRSQAMLDILTMTLGNYESARKHLLSINSRGVPQGSLFVRRIAEKGEPVICQIELNGHESGVSQRRGIQITLTLISGKYVVMLRNPIHSSVADIPVMAGLYSQDKKGNGLQISDSIILISEENVFKLIEENKND